MECNFQIIFSLIVKLIAILPHTIVALDDQVSSTQCPGSNPKNNTQCQASNPLIEKACENALYKDLCILNLSQLPTKETSDIKSIAFLSINNTMNYGSNVSEWITEKLKDNSGLSPDVKMGLNKCSEYYSEALEDLKRTIDSFKKVKVFNDRFFNDVNTFVSGAMSSSVHCEDEMKKFQGKHVMEDKNRGFKQFCSNTLAVTVFWSKNH